MSYSPVFVRSGNNYDMFAASDESALGDCGPGATKQSFKDECDINTIVERFGLTGQLPENVRMPVSGDFTDVVDFRGAMDSIVASREAFQAMPADVRKRFNNNPADFVDFCLDESNLAEARKLGLVLPEEVKQPKAASLDDVVQAINASRDAKTS